MSCDRTKHIDICHHFLRSRVEDGDLTVEFVPTDQQHADALTKALAAPSFNLHIGLIGVRKKP